MTGARKAAFARLLVIVMPATLFLAWLSKQFGEGTSRRAAIAELYAVGDEVAKHAPVATQYFIAASSACSDEERAALFRAGAKMGGSSDWLLKSHWGEAADCCEWKGVGCPGGHGVETLSLQKQALRGTLPSELALLTALRSVDINENSAISGTLPSQLAASPRLASLYAFGTSISGTLPTTFGGALEELEMSACQLSGTLPSSMGSAKSLRYLFLESNRISGAIPSWLGGLRRLRELELSHNRLSGSLPRAVTRLPLEHLDVAHNGEMRGVPQAAPKQGCSGGSEKYLRAQQATVPPRK